MSQADSPNTMSPSRRTVLAGLSVATASVAAVDILLAARVPGDDPDAELLGLSAQLDALWPELTAIRQASRSSCDAADEEADRRLGLVRGAELTLDEAEARWEMTRTVRYELGTEDVVHREGALWNRVDEIHRKIRGTRPRTLVGAAVQARAAAMLAVSELWDESEPDLDWDKAVIRNLIESICAAAGVALPLVLMNERVGTA